MSAQIKPDIRMLIARDVPNRFWLGQPKRKTPTLGQRGLGPEAEKTLWPGGLGSKHGV